MLRFQGDDDEIEGAASSDEESSSEDEDLRFLMNERKQKRLKAKERDANAEIKPKFYEIRPGEEFRHSDLSGQRTETSKASLGERVTRENVASVGIKSRGPLGSREMSFKLKSVRILQFFVTYIGFTFLCMSWWNSFLQRKDADRQRAQTHHEERRKIRRSAGGLRSKKNAWKK